MQLVLLDGHEDAIWTAAFSPSGDRILTASGDRTVRLWDLQGKLLATPLAEHRGPVTAAAFSPSGHHVLSASSHGRNVAALLSFGSGERLLELADEQDIEGFNREERERYAELLGGI